MGTVTNTGYTQSLMRVARAHHRLVVPLFINGGGSTNVLWTSKTRKRAAQNIKATVEKYHLDGINLDFELLNPSSRTDLTKFVADIASELRPLKKVVAVSVFPLVGVPASINGADDYAGLAHYANYLVVMAYDHHYSGGPPGPVAPYAWVEDNVKAALNKVAADKLVLAIGMYGYDWVNNGQAGNAPTVTDVAAVALAKAHGVTPTYDHANSQNTFTYTANGVSHVVWYMGNRSARARVNLAQTDHLSGVALWQLGDEEASFWSVLPSHP
jgi:spore germination protein YaaH